MKHHILDDFHPAVAEWFTETYGSPTPPQELGWPSIAEGKNTLILAPTGSGKTLAAFLWAINHLVDQHATENLPPGVRILYVSPLKALNNDIDRNLQVPLTGIARKAQALGIRIPPLHTAVRTGDTPQSKRKQMIAHPPDILITTPESLYLMLTAVRPRAIFRSVQYVIIDEIHALCGNKRGVHLSLSLERLQVVAEQEFVRVGLSATQKPLERIAAFLGGAGWTQENGHQVLRPRPVQIVDSGGRKSMDLRVVSPVPDFSRLPEEGAWPDIYGRLAQSIRDHKTTLIFVNNRRLAERLASELSLLFESRETGAPTAATNLYAVPRRTTGGQSPTTTGEQRPLVQAYHGSMSREAREAMEDALKRGQLTALVATSALELGIDIGSVDLVIQVQSPKGIARGLQRVGRSGHLVNATSTGMIVPTHREDLVEATVVAAAMLEHDVEPTTVPVNCLDVLAQQIVAMVSVEDLDVNGLFDIVRQAMPYHDLPRALFESVLAMLDGRFTEEAFRELRARVSWDRVNGILRALPGSSRLAITCGGTITDRGYFGVYLENGQTKVGEVEEEFVYESRTGDTFILGSSVWKIVTIDANRVTVAPAPGEPARMPFWRGEGLGRSPGLGRRVGEFRRILASRLDDPGCLDWLMASYPIDADAAWNLLDYFRRQRDACGEIPHDRLLVVETFRDEIGDPRVAVHSSLGRGTNGLIGMLLSRRLTDQGIIHQMLYNDDGILFRISDREDLPFDLCRGISEEYARKTILEELPGSALFAGHFRQNASRALLMPRLSPGKRTPLWLQRMRAGDLLEIVRGHKDFPMVVETMREVLNDVLNVSDVLALLREIESGEVRVLSVSSDTPSPFAASLLLDFIAVQMYVRDEPRARSSPGETPVSEECLRDILPVSALPGFFRPEALEAVDRRLQYAAPGFQARSAEELMHIVQRLGDLSDQEIADRSAANGAQMIRELANQGRVAQVILNGTLRWISVEERDLYGGLDDDEILSQIVSRHLRSHGPISRSVMSARYGIDRERLSALERRWETDRQFVRGRFQQPSSSEVGEDAWCFRPNIEQIHRQTISILRKEIAPVSMREFVLFLHQWTGLTHSGSTGDQATLESIAEAMQGLPIPIEAWEREIFFPRIAFYAAGQLHQLARDGSIVWSGAGSGKALPFVRGNGAVFCPVENLDAPFSPQAERILASLRNHGASFFSEIRTASGLSLHALNSGLAELFWRGLVSNDAFAELLALKRQVRDDEASIDPVQILNPQHNPSRPRLMGSARRALKQVPGWSGRWFLLNAPMVRGEMPPPDEMAEMQARQLLERYGIVAREFLAREQVLPWPALARAFQRMEFRGEIRRGMFVHGLSGTQFALHKAADELHRIQREPHDVLRVIATCDPANPYGGGVVVPVDTQPEPLRISRGIGNFLVFFDGSPILVIEGNGTRLRILGTCDEVILGEALKRFTSLLHLPESLRPFTEITVEYVDGCRPQESAVGRLLMRIGYIRGRDQTLRFDRYTTS